MQYPWRIIGHSPILDRLEQDLEQNRLAQSYLFCGPREIGKFRILKTFAQLLQCNTQNLCRSCDACLRVERNTHSGTIVVDRLWQKDRAEDLEELAQYSNFDQSQRQKSGKKSDQIGVDDVQEFTSALWQTTTARFKLCLIRDIERMTEEALNALLKILEEPPPKTIFLLTATHSDAVLPTIVSRTRLINLSLVPDAVLSAQLAAPEFERFAAEEKQKMLLLAQGRPARLNRFAKDPEFLRAQSALFAQIASLLSGKSVPLLLQTAEQLAKSADPDEIEEFLSSLLALLRTLLREKMLGTGLSLAANISPEKTLQILGTAELTRDLLAGNANKRFALEQLLLSFL